MSISLLSTTKNKIIFGTWWFITAELQFIFMNREFGVSFPYAVADALFTNISLAIFTWLIFTALRYYRPEKEKFLYLILFCTAMTIFWGLMIQFGYPALLPNNPEYLDFFRKSISLRYGAAFLLFSCACLISIVWYSLDDQRENEKRKTDAEKLAREAELFNLRQQLQPHFLFNSLNSISALAASRPQEARKMIQELSDFLRGTLRKDNQQLVTWKEEWQHLSLYLEIEKVRFGHRLSAKIESVEEADAAKIPSLLVQPLVENAIKFGLYDTTEQVEIRIDSQMENGFLYIKVTNPYDAQTSRGNAAGTGFGLNAVKRRLFLIYGRNDLLQTNMKDGYFCASLKIPQL